MTNMIKDNKEFVELLLSKKAKEISNNLSYKLFQFPKLSSIFIRVYLTYYAVSLLCDSEHYIVKKEYFKDIQSINSNFLYEILKDNNQETVVVVNKKIKQKLK